MKLGKKAKTGEIENPFRPQFGIPRRHTVCRITSDSPLSNTHHEEESDFTLQIDADQEPLFVQEMEYNIPSKDRFRDKTLDLYFTKEKYKDWIVDIAKDYFFYIYIADEAGKVTKLEGKEVQREKDRQAIDKT